MLVAHRTTLCTFLRTRSEREREREMEGSETGNQQSVPVPVKKVEGSKGGKSCKGCLYYSSVQKSKPTGKPLCVGISRTLHQIPSSVVGESELEASNEGRSLTDFKYVCVGYSVHLDRKDPSTDPQDMKQAELPLCVGIELLMDRRPTTADHCEAPACNKEDGQVLPRPPPKKPAYLIGEEYLGRFSRNAGLVASGVAKNVYRVGNHIKSNLDDMLYPYKRRPK